MYDTCTLELLENLCFGSKLLDDNMKLIVVILKTSMIIVTIQNNLKTIKMGLINLRKLKDSCDYFERTIIIT